jgi:hypothetical protein
MSRSENVLHAKCMALYIYIMKMEDSEGSMHFFMRLFSPADTTHEPVHYLPYPLSLIQKYSHHPPPYRSHLTFQASCYLSSSPNRSLSCPRKKLARHWYLWWRDLLGILAFTKLWCWKVIMPIFSGLIPPSLHLKRSWNLIFKNLNKFLFLKLFF